MSLESAGAFKVRLQSGYWILSRSKQGKGQSEYSKLDHNPENRSWFDESKARVSKGTQG